MSINIILNVKSNLFRIYSIESQDCELINKKFDNLYEQDKIA